MSLTVNFLCDVTGRERWHFGEGANRKPPLKRPVSRDFTVSGYKVIRQLFNNVTRPIRRY